MSFGFGISDFVCCGQLAYQLYTEFKEAAGDCQAFAQELLLLHQVILKIEALIGYGELAEADQATLGVYLDMCKDVLFVQIAGDNKPLLTENMTYGQKMVLGSPRNPNFPCKNTSINANVRIFRDWTSSLRQKLEERSFAQKIPKFRAAISAVTEKLTSFQVLMIRYSIAARDINEC